MIHFYLHEKLRYPMPIFRSVGKAGREEQQSDSFSGHLCYLSRYHKIYSFCCSVITHQHGPCQTEKANRSTHQNPCRKKLNAAFNVSILPSLRRGLARGVYLNAWMRLPLRVISRISRLYSRRLIKCRLPIMLWLMSLLICLTRGYFGYNPQQHMKPRTEKTHC